jgi:hypothetical protein
MNENVHIILDLDYETRCFRPTVEWMSERYDEANKKLFGGTLGKCDFKIFTTGRGSRGGTNGWFSFSAKGISVDWNYQLYSSGRSINKFNFYETAKPTISLNGNKRGSEWAFMVTLVHEMCHYYTYQNGIKPKRGHGREFTKIAKTITELTDGQIPITSYTTEDRSKHFIYDRVK